MFKLHRPTSGQTEIPSKRHQAHQTRRNRKENDMTRASIRSQITAAGARRMHLLSKPLPQDVQTTVDRSETTVKMARLIGGETCLTAQGKPPCKKHGHEFCRRRKRSDNHSRRNDKKGQNTAADPLGREFLGSTQRDHSFTIGSKNPRNQRQTKGKKNRCSENRKNS